MRTLEWDNMRVKVDGRQLHHIRFADDNAFIAPKISQAKHMLDDFDKACGKIGLRLNLTKTVFMKNELVSHAPFTLNGTNFSECSIDIYLGREINVLNDLTPELSRIKQSAWKAFKSIEDVVKRTRNTQLHARVYDSTVLPALTYASETWSLSKQDERSLDVNERTVKRAMPGVSHSKLVSDGIRSYELRQLSRIKDTVLYAKQLKIRCADHVMCMNNNRWARAV
ncbi:unnamed protein product [Angiostrongylus costaricensis]|uniref:Reverse transcriptase domain-containing protein n=1 Tax=Angiostrongylus costaricensis TaxID=334426 RepID=A0A0R3Q1T5_ANGCS|nr:unnamed protein product [Angiostrongylus costaricensis]